MEKKLKDYLFLYLGCEYKKNYKYKTSYNMTRPCFVTPSAIYPLFDALESPDLYDIKLILRPLSDMSKKEMEECGNIIYDFSNDEELNKWEWRDFEIGLAPEQFYYLLSKHFDLFGLIEAGLAIDKTLVTQTP